MKGDYRKFFLMLLISFVLMYLVMFLNVFSWDHVYFSLTRFYMVLLMISSMSVVMIAFMWDMYSDKKFNLVIVVGSVLIFILALFFLRGQVFVDDVDYVRAMIPHHSSAILTSSYADLEDPEVRELADEIIRAQEEEIVLMKRILGSG